MERTPDRRLAAILFSDIVGYTAMMQRDEKEGLNHVRRYKQVLKSEVDNNGGEILHHYGDGSLCVFPSGISAINCAKNIQEALAKGTPVPLRIGIHIGDVVKQEDSILW